MEKSLEKAISVTRLVLMKYDGLFPSRRDAAREALHKRKGIFKRAEDDELRKSDAINLTQFIYLNDAICRELSKRDASGSELLKWLNAVRKELTRSELS